MNPHENFRTETPEATVVLDTKLGKIKDFFSFLYRNRVELIALVLGTAIAIDVDTVAESVDK